MSTTDPSLTNPTADPAAAFQRLLEQNKNDGIAVASKLFDENFRYRGEVRDLKKKVPVEGSVVLSADEAKEWEAFKALGKKARGPQGHGRIRRETRKGKQRARRDRGSPFSRRPWTWGIKPQSLCPRQIAASPKP
jgi:hypothetical protein